MRRVVFVVLAAHMFLLTGRLLAGDKPVAEDELTTLKRALISGLRWSSPSPAVETWP
jgi:hypothetical protein